MNPNDFNSLLASYSPQAASSPVVNSTTPAVPAAPQERGNWFTHSLSTIGGIGGGLLGAVFGGGVGGIGGAAAGSAGGKALENILEGKGAGDDVIKSGVEGGVGELVGGGVGKVLGKGAEFLGSRAAKLTGDAEAAATAKAAQDAELGAAQATRNNFGGIKPGVQSSNNLEGNQKLMQSWGLDHTSPQAMADASKGGLFINDINQAALAAGSPIPTSKLITSGDITKMTPAEQQALISPKVAIIGEDGALPKTVTPQQAHAFAQDLNSQIRDMQSVAENAKANGNINDYNTAKQQLGELTKKYNSVQGLAGTPEVNAAIAARNITPEEKAQLVEQFGKQQADHIEQAVNSAQTHQDLVKAKLPFAQMNSLSDLALRDMKASGTTRALARAKTDINGDGVADAGAPVEPSPAETTAHFVANNTGGSLVNTAIKGAMAAKDNPAILTTLSRIGKLGAKIAPPAGAAASVANGELQSSINNPNGATTMQPQQPGAMVSAAPGAPTNGLSRDDLVTLMLYGGPASTALFDSMAAQQPRAAAADTATTALAGLQGQSPDMGIMSSIAGKFGLGSTGEYQRKAAAAAQQVAAAMPGTDAGHIESMLTNYMAGGANIDQAIQQLMANLHSVKQNNTNGAYQSLMNYVPAAV